MPRIPFLLFLVFATFSVNAQVTLYRDTLIKVLHQNSVLNNAWAGGFNSPVFAELDLDNDGRMDLVSFESQTRRVNPFINIGGSSRNYIYAPVYRSQFPGALEGWIRTYDFDQDGDMDLFTYTNAGIAVYQNQSSPGSPVQFTLFNPQLQTHYGSFQTNIYVSRVNMPALSDLDNDGDMDVLAFSIAGNWIEHHKNLSADSTGNPFGFLFYNVPQCWGYFALSSFTNSAQLPVIPSCPLYPADPFRTSAIKNPEPEQDARYRHAGSALLALDMDGDGDKDILNGDILGPNLLYVQNCGTPDSAYACQQDSLFPVYDTPAIMADVAGPYYMDVNNDGNKDLIVSNFFTGEDFHNVRYYRNTTNNTTNVFGFQTDRFLSSEMIETGSGAHPVFTDISGDGLDDLVIANDYYYNGNLNQGQLAYYRNSGTAAQAQYTLVNDNYLNLTSMNIRNLYPAFGDLDGDGDKDMLLGENTGTLLYFQNIAGAGQTANFIFSQGNYQSIDIGDNAAPQLIDADRDGLLDMIIGKRNGTLSYYRNTGSAAVPVFTLQSAAFGGVSVLKVNSFAGYAAPAMFDRNGSYELLVGSESGYLYHYTNIDGNLAGTFTLVDSMYQGIFEPVRATPAVGHVDGDGKYDVIVGNFSGGCVLYSQNTILSDPESMAVLTPNMELYPNPSAGNFTVKLDKILPSPATLTVTDLSGRILHRSFVRSETELQLQQLTSGMYICTLQYNGKSVSELFVKN